MRQNTSALLCAQLRITTIVRVAEGWQRRIEVNDVERSRQGRAGPGLIAVGLLQAVLVAGLVADPARLATAPIRSLDYAAHFYGALHTANRLRASGAFWGYDPWWAAGYPDGHVAVIDNKFFSALLLVAPRGWEALVFNLGVLAMLVAVPWLLALASRLAGGSSRESWCTALAAVVAVFSVPISVFFWSWGGISFFFASIAAIPIAVAIGSTLGEVSIVSRRGVAVSLGAVFVVFVHPVAALVLAFGCLPLLWTGPRPFAERLRDLVLLVGLLAVPVLPVAEATLRLRAPLRPIALWVHDTLRGGLQQLVLDWWVHAFDTKALPSGAGGLAAIVILASLGARSENPARRSRSSRIAGQVIVLGISGCAAAAYVIPSLVDRFAALQPLRFLVPFSFFACIPAGRGIARGIGRLATRRPIAWLTALALVLVVGNAVRGLALILVLGHGADPAEPEVVTFLERESREDDRVLVESSGFALPVEGPFWRVIDVQRFGLLPLSIRREFIGYAGTTPFMAHRYAKFVGAELLGQDLGRLGDDGLKTLLDRYSVAWVVACSANALAELRKHPSIVEETANAADCRILRVTEPARTRFLEGAGRVHAEIDRIEVTEASGERLVLKYHWVPGLRTEPALRIAEAPQPGAPVGFIAVWPEGVRSFAIVPRGPFEVLRGSSSQGGNPMR